MKKFSYLLGFNPVCVGPIGTLFVSSCISEEALRVQGSKMALTTISSPLKAYQTFANRVSHLKRKLDTLKGTVPDLDESPIPSPSADAPSPTGSESPFHGLELAHPDPDLDGSAMDDDAEPPAPSPLSSPGGSPRPTEVLGENDNREVEDMELSEDETDGGGIIGKE